MTWEYLALAMAAYSLLRAAKIIIDIIIRTWR